MSRPFSGGCACAAIRYECRAEPVFSWQCHCRDCQRASGGMPCPVMYVPKTALTISGRAKYYEVQADSGNAVRRGFCARGDASISPLRQAQGYAQHDRTS